MIRRPRSHGGRAVLYGGASGLLAGLLLTTMMTVMSLLRGNDIWYGMKGAAAPFLGARAMEPGFDVLAVWLGLALHLAICVGWAIPFVFLAYELRSAWTLVAGAAWGIVVWLAMFYVLLPAVGLSQMTYEAPVSRAIAYHVFFGLAVAASFLSVKRIEARGQRRLPAAHAA